MVQEVKETRDLLEEFRRRLEEVESKVREMEEREATRDAELVTLRELETRRKIETAQREANSVVAEVERAEREAQLDLELARLREVEKRAQELEALAASPSPLATAYLPEIRPEPQSFPAESAKPVPGPAAVLSRVVSRVHKRRRPQPDTTSSAADIFEPDSFSALPSYVLFVGLGVCAVVLRVVLKRTAGRQLRS
ncbi:hypothetical protein HETIRDRAFT_382686 [Heterobasidion irregulare TC 32-1]|uniref:Uncharacterized protein n=1 Tax=Heterobasidion irregulare (strain TC 32-1) TaxID=747525 RepID=W4K9U3_HETIT|nr:uncharacterized protein HETIRDRAFT_473756 [Heterobasidion irregulare TC 32-1]XP_009544965.1 uncharacterized protein HETIRDRAFT_382686 [Heterobasidion irregulare TC 32-1]ETW82612.1 hypothetical protein HETIRDRAFT_473756 [Heterobasidion irregulare TC 32-1]ETW82617.1 hypothetical protein HETIRDRAFT_382686 [Heterobasidion irregulare TC 32-1]